MPDKDVVNHLMTEHSVGWCILHRDRIEQLPVFEHGPNGRRIVIIVPFDGDAELFKLTARLPWFNLHHLTDGEIRLAWDGTSSDPGEALEHFGAELDKIDEYLAWCHPDIQKHQDRLREELPILVARRRQMLIANQRLEGGLGFPVRE